MPPDCVCMFAATSLTLVPTEAVENWNELPPWTLINKDVPVRLHGQKGRSSDRLKDRTRRADDTLMRSSDGRTKGAALYRRVLLWVFVALLVLCGAWIVLFVIAALTGNIE